MTELEEDLKKELAHLRISLHQREADLESLENQLNESKHQVEGLKTLLEAQSRLLAHYQAAFDAVDDLEDASAPAEPPKHTLGELMGDK